MNALPNFARKVACPSLALPRTLSTRGATVCLSGIPDFAAILLLPQESTMMLRTNRTIQRWLWLPFPATTLAPSPKHRFRVCVVWLIAAIAVPCSAVAHHLADQTDCQQSFVIPSVIPRGDESIFFLQNVAPGRPQRERGEVLKQTTSGRKVPRA